MCLCLQFLCVSLHRSVSALRLVTLQTASECATGDKEQGVGAMSQSKSGRTKWNLAIAVLVGLSVAIIAAVIVKGKSLR